MAAKFNFTPHKKSTTLLDQNFKLEEGAGTAEYPQQSVNLTGCIIRMQLRTSQEGPTEIELNTLPNGGMSITDAVNGLFRINQQLISFPAFDYLYAIQIEFPDGTVDEFLEGTWSIVEDTVN